MMQRTQHLGFVLAGLTFAALAGNAAAQQPTQAQASAIRQSCRSDYQAHCANVPTGGSAALQCLQGNMASLSQGCHAAVAAATEGATGSAPPAAPGGPGPAAPLPGNMPMHGNMPMRDSMMMLRQSCGGDFRSLCRGIMPGGGRALQCLADHQESLSQPCREALATARAAR
jgi:cysteine rich repeat protein